MSMLLLVVFTIFGAATAAISDYLSPVSYDLDFKLDLDNVKDGFSGASSMVFETSSNLNRGIMSVVLNSLNLTITSAVILYPDNKRFSIKNIIYNSTTEIVELKIDQELSPSSKYTLMLEFTGSLNGTQGFFISQVGTENYLGTSTYPVYSRRVYPCLDKPNLRAKYTLNLSVFYSRKQHPIIISGLKGSYDVMTKNKNKYISGKYTSDINLPPYGFFFTAGSYEELQKDYPIFLPHDIKQRYNDDLVDALASNVVKDLSNNAGFDLKMVVVPGLPAPTASGYGIAAVSSSVGLTATDDTTAIQIEQALEIFKAVIRCFFATVVSPSSWENIWLAESISAYIAHAAFNQLTTNWKNWPSIEVAALQQFAMSNSWSIDSSPVIPGNLNSSEEVVKFISDPAIIKGSAVLATLETLAKSSAPFAPFIGFINEFKGKAVSTEDFLNYYEQKNDMNHTLPDGKTLVSIMNPWLTQAGYPYLTVSRFNHQVYVNKKRFVSTDNNHAWVLPLTFKIFYLNSTNNTNALQSDVNYVWLSDVENGNYTIAKDSSHNLLVLCNIKGPGAYRVLYDSSSLRYITNNLKADVNYLGDQTLRSTLISDNFAFLQHELITYSTLFDTLRYLTNERSLTPWLIASRGLREYWSLMYFSDLRLPFQNYVTHLMRPTYQKYGIKIANPDSVEGLLMAEIINSMCDYGDEVCRNETKNAYNTHIAQKQSVANVDIIDQLYCNGLRDVLDGQRISQMLRDGYQQTMGQYRKKSLFYYLSCSGGEYGGSDAIANLLEDVMVSSTYLAMPDEDMILAFKEIANKPQHYVQALKFFTGQFTKIRATLAIEQRAELIRYLGNLGSTDDHLVIFGNFTYGNSSDSTILNAVKDAMRAVQTRKQFLGSHYNDIYQGLNGYEPLPTSPSPPNSSTEGPTNKPTSKPTTKPNPANGSPTSATIVPALLASSYLMLRYLV